MSAKKLAVAQIRVVRDYTNSIIETIPFTDWLRLPAGCPSNIAWQVGHLSMATYRLGLERIRGDRHDDIDLVPRAIFDLYGKGTLPDPSPEKNLPAAELKVILDRVHAALLEEQEEWSDDFLLGTTEKPHRLFTQKIDALWWCGRHEMLHAGQIGLIRRMLGQDPIW